MTKDEYVKLVYEFSEAHSFTPEAMPRIARLRNLLISAYVDLPNGDAVELTKALRHIMWIKDCGCDWVVDGKLVNHADAERDAMYDIAKRALQSSAHS